MTTKTTTKGRPPPLVLTHPPPVPEPCKACGKDVRDMRRHKGSAACKNEARKAMIARLGMIEVWHRMSRVLTEGCVPVVIVRERKDGKDKRRWYADPSAVGAADKLFQAGIEDKRISRLLRGSKDELERELALAALAGKREQVDIPIPPFQQASAHAVVTPGGGVQVVLRPRSP